MPDNFTFYTDSVSYGIEVKADGDKVHYVSGYISTPDLDIYNDIVSQDCLDDMLVQIKSGNVKLDVEHEAWRKSSQTLPAGRIVDAKRDLKGVWIKAIINKHAPNFKAIWGSIKDGFLDAFSIAFKAITAEEEIVNGVKARILKKIDLLNVALTGNPINPECKMQAVFMKSVESMKKGDKMVEEKDKTGSETTDPKVKTEVKNDGETSKGKKEAESGKEASKEAKKEDEEEKKSLDKLKANLETKDKEAEAKDKEIAELKAKLKAPVHKSQVDEKSVKDTPPEFKASGRTPLEMIR